MTQFKISMNRFSFSLAAFVLLLLIAACGGGNRKTPQDAAQGFLDAISAGDYDGAREYCTEGTKGNLTLLETFSGLGANPSQGKFEITREDVQGDYATVYYNKEGSEQFVRLHKEGDQWLVLANKGDMGMGKDKEKDSKPDLLKDMEEEAAEEPADLYKPERDGKNAEEIANEFLLAFSYNDLDKAKHFASKSTAEALSMQSGLDTDENGKKVSTEFKISKVDERGEYASVFYKNKGDLKAKELKLGKDKHGNWEVIMTKSDFSDWDK